MTPLYQQRSELIAANVTLILRWLELLTPEHRRYVIESMVRRFSLPQLRVMQDHVASEIARAEAKR